MLKSVNMSSSEYDFVNTSKLRLKDDKNQIKWVENVSFFKCCQCFSCFRKKKKKQDSKKLSQTLSKLGDNKLAQELCKLVEKDDKAEQLLEQIAEKEFLKPGPTKAEIAFKNMQEKKVIFLNWSLINV